MSIKDPAIQAALKDDPEQVYFWVNTMKDRAFQKLAKQQLFRGGAINSQLVVSCM